MKKSLINNVVLISLIVFLFVYNFIIREMMEPSLFYLNAFLLLVEAVVFLYTFTFMKQSTINIIKKILIVFISVVGILFIASWIYTKSTGYIFIYESYRIVYISFLIYPAILLVMLLLYSNKVVGDNSRLITGITSVLVLAIMLLHGTLVMFGLDTVEVNRIENEPNEILVTDSMFLHGTVYRYHQVNIFFMEFDEVADEW